MWVWLGVFSIVLNPSNSSTQIRSVAPGTLSTWRLHVLDIEKYYIITGSIVFGFSRSDGFFIGRAAGPASLVPWALFVGVRPDGLDGWEGLPGVLDWDLDDAIDTITQSVLEVWKDLHDIIFKVNLSQCKIPGRYSSCLQAIFSARLWGKLKVSNFFRNFSICNWTAKCLCLSVYSWKDFH